MCYANARPKIPAALKSLLRSEMEKAIYEANLGTDDGLIADRYLIERIPQADIAAELGCDQCTVSRRIPCILQRVEFAARKMGYCI
nr:MAG TPA: ECF sigma factor [Caudoviricetes sp.]